MLLIDLDQKRIISDEELKKSLATQHPYKDWLKRTQVVLRELPPARTKRPKIAVPCSIASRPSATPRKTSSS